VQPLLLGGANSSNNVLQDPAVLKLLEQYKAPVEKLQTQVVGEWGNPGRAPPVCAAEGSRTTPFIGAVEGGHAVMQAWQR
jgi:hypothetical protein